MISIGNAEAQYYCFPRGAGDVVAKTRLATEELYRMALQEKKMRGEASKAVKTAEK